MKKGQDTDFWKYLTYIILVLAMFAVLIYILKTKVLP